MTERLDGTLEVELQVRGDTLFDGYLNRPDATEASFDGPWFRTGDAAYQDENDYVYIYDRVKDMIVSGGENVYPAEVENALMKHPGIADVAVIGVPHPKWSERPLACVVVNPGDSLTKDEVLDHIRGSLAKWQVPDDVVFIDEVPKTSVGKFSKKTLRERFADYVLPEN